MFNEIVEHNPCLIIIFLLNWWKKVKNKSSVIYIYHHIYSRKAVEPTDQDNITKSNKNDTDPKEMGGIMKIHSQEFRHFVSISGLELFLLFTLTETFLSEYKFRSNFFFNFFFILSSSFKSLFYAVFFMDCISLLAILL